MGIQLLFRAGRRRRPRPRMGIRTEFSDSRFPVEGTAEARLGNASTVTSRIRTRATSRRKVFVIGPTVAFKPTRNTRLDLSPLFGVTFDAPRVQAFAVFSYTFGPGRGGTRSRGASVNAESMTVTVGGVTLLRSEFSSWARMNDAVIRVFAHGHSPRSRRHQQRSDLRQGGQLPRPVPPQPLR